MNAKSDKIKFFGLILDDEKIFYANISFRRAFS
jgi:hypothetical protein